MKKASARPQEQVFIDLTIDNNEHEGHGVVPSISPQSGLKEDESPSEELSSSEESVSNDNEDGNDHCHDSLMNR